MFYMRYNLKIWLNKHNSKEEGAMKKLFAVIMILSLLSFVFPAAGLAKEETSAVASPKCDMEKLKKIGGDAIVKIEKGSWEGGFNVTLNTDKMTFNDLIQKMVAEGCM